MKKSIFFLCVLTILFSITGCEKTELEQYTLATPITMSLNEFRNSVDVIAPRPIEESGKIYVYNNYILVNDKEKGIHIIDNSNPESPKKIAFISILGNVDMSVKGNYLYADSFIDLVVFDISDIENIIEVDRLEDVFPSYFMFSASVEADYYDWSAYNYEEIIVDWNVSVKQKIPGEELTYTPTVWGFGDLLFNTTTGAENQVGQGGSLARFKIVEDYLYTVDSHSIHLFNIENLESPTKTGSVYAGFDIETIFNRGNHLFLGSMSGMFIYDITQADSPQYVSEFRHGTACDPVVVDGDYAYITLRGGNSCGAFESSLEIIDISNISNPSLTKRYPMNNPYGLGIKNDLLFVCDGTSGLKVFNKSDINNLQLLGIYENVNAFDVIPLDDQLVMIADDKVFQFRYLSNNGIQLLSEFSLN